MAYWIAAAEEERHTEATYFSSSAGTLMMKKSFTALLEPDGTRLRWVVARLPFRLAETWPERAGRRVCGTLNGAPFRSSLFGDARGPGEMLLVNRALQLAAGVRVGETVRIALEPDLEERTDALPAELGKLLRGERELKRWFAQLGPSMRREIGKWVAEPKTATTRQKRAEKMAERLMLAMEGEQDPPPVLRALFRETVKAEDAWLALTPVQRRNHLLGIFYYESVDARQRRARKAVEEALARAENRKNAP
ncbi:YdeI/OmpD-associated family protein [Telmatobacter bradus]|uniref:YdeI/OmpD-associated family protein n=1 Tax=Telmatobacter bradus TaxID=474953 RepID=UPI003B429315